MKQTIKTTYIEGENIKRLEHIKANTTANNEIRVFLCHHTMTRATLDKCTEELKLNIHTPDLDTLADKRYIEKLSIRILLAVLIGKENYIQYHATGRPYLPQSPFEISISHTQHTYALSLSTIRHGIDIEKWSDKPQRVAQMYVNKQDYLSEHALAQKSIWHTTLWSAKEAVYKLYDQAGLSFKNDILVQEWGTDCLQILSPRLNKECNVRYTCYPHFVLTIAYQP